MSEAVRPLCGAFLRRCSIVLLANGQFNKGICREILNHDKTQLTSTLPVADSSLWCGKFPTTASSDSPGANPRQHAFSVDST